MPYQIQINAYIFLSGENYMKKKILMIYPEFPTTYWSLKHALSFVNKKSAMIPLGLLTVAALLPEDYSIKIVDMNVEKLRDSDIKEADLVFLSAMIVQKPSFDSVVARCNAFGIPVVAGGPYPTSSHEKINGVSHFVLDEAETTLPGFIRDLENGTAKQLYTSKERPDITKTPAPRFDLIDFRHYNNVALQNSRGCPFNCEFCDIVQLFGRVPRYKTPEQFIHEMDLVFAQGFRGSLFIVDDNFIGDKPKVKDLLRAIITWQNAHGYPFTLFTEASINLADDDELLSLMTESGFDMVFLGIETPDADSLRSCSKSQNLDRNMYSSITKIQNAGIEVSGGFIVGFDSDKEDIFDRQIEFIQNAGIPMAMIGILGALPGTKLFQRLESEGRINKNNEFSGDNTHNLRMSFTPLMEEEVIVDGYKRILADIYSPAKYFDRCYNLITKLPSRRRKTGKRITLSDLRAVFRSLTHQGLSRYSPQYFRFLLKVLITKTGKFPLAIEHAIKGRHFFIITNDILKADELSSRIEAAKKILTDAIASITTAPGEKPNRYAKQIRELSRYRKYIEKKYARISEDAQRYLRDQFEECIESFDEFFARMQTAYAM